MTQTHLIKLIIEILFLIALYIIARKQNKLGGRISVLEEKGLTHIINITGGGGSGGGKKEPSFKSKIKSEEKRIQDYRFRK